MAKRRKRARQPEALRGLDGPIMLIVDEVEYYEEAGELSDSAWASLARRVLDEQAMQGGDDAAGDHGVALRG